MEVKRFPTRAEAEKFVAKFAHGRTISRLAPLTIVADGAEWVVDNPDRGPMFVPAKAPVPERARQVIRVPSSRDPRVIYEVSSDDGATWKCTCPGFTYRAKCRHTEGR